MSEMKIVPENKHDDVACANLLRAGDEEVLEKIDELLEWQQDMNWPVAAEVCSRLSRLGVKLQAAVQRVLETDDGMWKYFLLTNLIPTAGPDLIRSLSPTLARTLKHPTQSDRENDVVLVIQELQEQYQFL
eukprot:TRINITY_DN13265_c0_g1_i1.p2 TRINITY_DN13265_c0_g1~~TRINITY_DN13265_c0_g1_i1.p2  ORF type:complete len:131 (+),score=27.44 TRINITY_DN13265_c0_g1_i1:52-444(+)